MYQFGPFSPFQFRMMAQFLTAAHLLLALLAVGHNHHPASASDCCTLERSASSSVAHLYEPSAAVYPDALECPFCHLLHSLKTSATPPAWVFVGAMDWAADAFPATPANRIGAYLPDSRAPPIA